MSYHSDDSSDGQAEKDEPMHTPESAYEGKKPPNFNMNSDEAPPKKDERGRVYLPYYKEELEKLIVTDPEKAWENCKKDKYFAMVRRQAIESLKKSPLYKNNENLKKFIEYGEQALKELFVKGISVVDEYGLAMTVDLIIEAWRLDYQQQQALLFPNDRYIQMLTHLEKMAFGPIESTIVKEALKSIEDVVGYEHKIAKKHYEIVDDLVNMVFDAKIFEKLCEKYGRTETMTSLFLTFAGNKDLRHRLLRGMSLKLADFILNEFDSLPEKDKYVVALYPRVLSTLWNPPEASDEKGDDEEKEEKEETEGEPSDPSKPEMTETEPKSSDKEEESKTKPSSAEKKDSEAT